MTKTLNKDPYTQAIRWLGHRDYSEEGMTRRLRQRGYGEEVIGHTINQLVSQGWIDDAQLSRRIIERCVATRTMGPSLIRQRLQNQGIPCDISDPLLVAYTDEINWLEIAEHLSERYDMNEPRERLRLGRYLVRRGFPVSVVWRLAGSDVASGVEEEC